MNSLDKSISIRDSGPAGSGNLPKRRVLVIILTLMLAQMVQAAIIQLDIETLIAVPTQVHAIESAAVRNGIVESFAGAIADVYWWGIPVTSLAVVLAVLVPEYRLREKAAIGN